LYCFVVLLPLLVFNKYIFNYWTSNVYWLWKVICLCNIITIFPVVFYILVLGSTGRTRITGYIIDNKEHGLSLVCIVYRQKLSCLLHYGNRLFAVLHIHGLGIKLNVVYHFATLCVCRYSSKANDSCCLSSTYWCLLLCCRKTVFANKQPGEPRMSPMWQIVSMAVQSS